MEKPSDLKREHPALQKMKVIDLFNIFLDHFCVLGSGYGSRDPIGIQEFLSIK
jgi:hypothetical protein